MPRLFSNDVLAAVNDCDKLKRLRLPAEKEPVVGVQGVRRQADSRRAGVAPDGGAESIVLPEPVARRGERPVAAAFETEGVAAERGVPQLCHRPVAGAPLPDPEVFRGAAEIVRNHNWPDPLQRDICDRQVL